ncbi:aa3-type cytochrome c oxidase subunit IV [Pelagibacteraceae bacterium]|nr:aa3-type cytochrome c oxidase subunit IV [Pelagibacteraceae bacterium]
MDISEQKKTYNFFGKLILWGSIAVVVVLVFMAIFLI